MFSHIGNTHILLLSLGMAIGKQIVRRKARRRPSFKKNRGPLYLNFRGMTNRLLFVLCWSARLYATSRPDFAQVIDR